MMAGGSGLRRGEVVKGSCQWPVVCCRLKLELPPFREQHAKGWGTHRADAWPVTRLARWRGNLVPSPQLGSLDGVAHQHRDRERAYSAGNGRECARDFCDLGMHVADERRTISGETLFALGIAGEELGKLRRVGDFVHPHVDDAG